MKGAMLTTVLLVGRIGASQVPGGSDNAASYRLRGDAAIEQGDFSTALDAYQAAYNAGGKKDFELLKRMATVYQWTREYTEAEELLGAVIHASPTDEEATTSFFRLRKRRGLHLSGGYGEGEIDYTKRVYSLSGFYGGIDWLDLRAGFGQSSKLAYDRSDLWFDAFIFPTYRTYLRLGVRQKHYTYPVSVTASPDVNAYTKVPDYQLELGHYYLGENYMSIEVEYFVPQFYWNPGLRSHNYKIGGELRQWISRPVYARFFAATLHDPDPQSVIVNPSEKRVTGFGYENMTLIGGALGFEGDKLNGEVKYIPDRDLDRSLNWSLFATVQVDANSFQARYDFLYDRYPSTSERSFLWSQVHMVTAIVEPIPSVELRIGMKTMIQSVTTVLPFASLQLSTAL